MRYCIRFTSIIQLSDGRICSGSSSFDNSIKIWNLKNVINLHTNYNRHISLLDTYSNHEGLFRNSVYFLIYLINIQSLRFCN